MVHGICIYLLLQILRNRNLKPFFNILGFQIISLVYSLLLRATLLRYGRVQSATTFQEPHPGAQKEESGTKNIMIRTIKNVASGKKEGDEPGGR